MIIQLSFILSFTFKLSHLLQGIEHGLGYLLISRIHIGAYLQCVCSNELVFDTRGVSREDLNELRDAFPPFTR